jgi:acylphosphatase
LKSVRVSISGRVQGVWFRAWTMEQADSLGLSGWVRNRQDGRVEAVFSGPETAVVAMLEAIKAGPRLARVDDIETEPCDTPEKGFAKLPTV